MARGLSRTMPMQAHPALALSLLALLLMALTLSSCNTAEGVGEDVSAAGDAMSDTADNVKDEM